MSFGSTRWLKSSRVAGKPAKVGQPGRPPRPGRVDEQLAGRAGLPRWNAEDRADDPLRSINSYGATKARAEPLRARVEAASEGIQAKHTGWANPPSVREDTVVKLRIDR